MASTLTPEIRNPGPIEMDQDAINLAKAIRQKESGGNFNATGDAGTSKGGYQWQPATWKEHAKKVLGNENAQMTPENQNAVAYGVIKSWKDKGLNPAQIAAKWNSGSESGWEKKVGVNVINGQQIKYNVPKYVKEVTDNYQSLKAQNATKQAEIQKTTQTTSLPQEQPKKNIFGGIVDVGKGALKGLGSTAVGLGELALKGYSLLPGEQPSAKQGLENAEYIKENILKPKTTGEKIGYGAEQIAEFFVPAGIATKGVKALQSTKYLGALNKAKDLNLLGKSIRIAGNLGVKSGIGALEAGSVRAAQTGGDIEETKSAAMYGAAIPAVAPIFGKAVQKLASKTPTTKIMEMVEKSNPLRTSYEKGIKYVKEGGKLVEKSNPIQSLKIRKLVPEVVDGRTDTRKIIQSLTEELQSVAGSRASKITSSKSILYSKFKDDVVSAIKSSKELRNSGQVQSTIKKVENLLKDYKKSFGNRMTLKTLDDIRVTMNKKYDPELRDAFRMIGDAARRNIYVMDKTSKAMLDKEAEILVARDFAKTLHNKVIKGGRLGGYVNMILGGIIGSQIPFVGPIAGAVGGKSLSKAMQSAYFRTPGSETAQKIIQKAPEVAKTVFGVK